VPVVSVEVAGQLLGMSRSAAYRAADRGEIPTIRLGGGLLVPVAALYALLLLPVPPPGGRPVVDR
jgi:excisionase family DNA binding protein